MIRYTILILILLFTSCKSLEGSKYYLSKKHPNDVEIKELFFKDDSTAILTLNNDKSIKIKYFKPNRNYLIINKVEQENLNLPFEKGDSIIIFRKELYYFKNNYKLVFEKIVN